MIGSNRRKPNQSPEPMAVLRTAIGSSLTLGKDRMTTVTLFRPVGPKELALIESSGWRAFPPRLPEQPIFYPVTNEDYAIQIARDWNVKSSGSGFVTRFEVDAEYASRFPKKVVGSRVHEELWVPAEELAEFNSKIVGKIEVTHAFPEKRPNQPAQPTPGS